MTRRLFRSLALLYVLGGLSATSMAQPAPISRLIITVVDPSRLVIPGAVVTVVGIDDATKKTNIAPIKSTDRGLATFEGLPLGRYAVHGEFPGFELGAIGELRLKAGDNRHLLLLPLARMTTEITVARDPQTTASDRGTTFGSALTREQIDALSDDPNEMAKQLQDMAGAGAAIRVDSFEGQQLPPKAQIKAIHITRDKFAAENHSAGGMFVDIITQPGIGALQGTVRLSLADSALDGRNPLIPKKGPAQWQNPVFSVSGPLIKDKSSVGLWVSRYHGYTTPIQYAATPTGTLAENMNVRVLEDMLAVQGMFDYALTPDQTLRAVGYRYTDRMRNLGVGAYDLIERAYSTQDTAAVLRLQEAGPIGRRFFINTRLLMTWNDSTSTSSLEAPTVIVNDAFTSGGAQRSGGRHTRRLSLQSDLDYVRGVHSWRTGISFDGGRYRSDDTANVLGTYTFESLAAFQAGLPRTYTRRIGDPSISYWNVQAAWYLQDDIRVRKSLTLSPGIRVEAQTHLNDHNNIGPRFGITWAPFKSGKTTLRASVGRFYDWLNAGTYEQTLRVDGFRQQELNIVTPAYPDTGTLGLIPATNRYLLGADARMANNTRVSFGLDQQITKVMRINVLYADTWASGLLAGDNLNAPVDGVRSNPTFANIIETASAGESRSRSLATTLNLNLAPPSIGPATTGRRFNWRRGLIVYAGYTLATARNNVDDAFSVPASGRLDTEWGPSFGDVRHRVYASLNSTALKNLTAMIAIRASSGSPYTIRTGRDDNGDLLFNDRPAGVGRNTERATGQWDVYGNFSYTIGFGTKKVPGGLGISVTSTASGLQVTPVDRGNLTRYRLVFSAYVQNLTNHANYVGYNGNMTSPFFLKPTNVQGVRTVSLSASLSF
ncbi:MAG: TonB-dependent receptor [Acidobacteria bacterium]|nr:TonB-dependent receptor [Acidobacteriota bacterium]